MPVGWVPTTSTTRRRWVTTGALALIVYAKTLNSPTDCCLAPGIVPWRRSRAGGNATRVAPWNCFRSSLRSPAGCPKSHAGTSKGGSTRAGHTDQNVVKSATCGSVTRTGGPPPRRRWGIAHNARLLAQSEDLRATAEPRFPATGRKQRLFGSMHCCAHSWDRARRVIVKAEHSSLGSNLRSWSLVCRARNRYSYDRLYSPGGAVGCA